MWLAAGLFEGRTEWMGKEDGEERLELMGLTAQMDCLERMDCRVCLELMASPAVMGYLELMVFQVQMVWMDCLERMEWTGFQEILDSQDFLDFLEVMACQVIRAYRVAMAILGLTDCLDCQGQKILLFP